MENEVHSTFLSDHCHRETVEFLSDGEKIEAYLYTPSATPRGANFPAVVTAPGFGGVKEMLIESYAPYLTEAGYACLSLDYRHFGASAGSPRQYLDPTRQVEDVRAGIGFLESNPMIDSNRLGIWGTSMSGGHAITVSAIDKRVKAAVAIIPFLYTGKPTGDMRAIWCAMFLDMARRFVGRTPRTIPVFAESPGDFAVMTSDGGWDWMQDMIKSASNYRNEVTLQSLLKVTRYRPADYAKRLTAPTLLMAAKADSITPAEPIREFCRSLTCQKDYIEYPESHFELFGDDLPATAREMVKWFKMHL